MRLEHLTPWQRAIVLSRAPETRPVRTTRFARWLLFMFSLGVVVGVTLAVGWLP